MKFKESKNGIPMIQINDTDYISFGKSFDKTKIIKSILISQIDHRGVRRSSKISVNFKKVPRSIKYHLGAKNYEIIKELFGMFVKNGELHYNNIEDMKKEL